MSVNINVITYSSNKTIEYVNLNSDIVNISLSNEIINLPYDTSYILYIQPDIKEIGFTGFLSLSNNIFSGFSGYVWIIIIMVIFFYLIKGVKNYVK